EDGDGHALKYKRLKSSFIRSIHPLTDLLKKGFRNESLIRKSKSSPVLCSWVQLANTKSSRSLSSFSTHTLRNSGSQVSSESRLDIRDPLEFRNPLFRAEAC